MPDSKLEDNLGLFTKFHRQKPLPKEVSVVVTAVCGGLTSNMYLAI